jgi:hypothetical protein
MKMKAGEIYNVKNWRGEEIFSNVMAASNGVSAIFG